MNRHCRILQKRPWVFSSRRTSTKLLKQSEAKSLFPGNWNPSLLYKMPDCFKAPYQLSMSPKKAYLFLITSVPHQYYLLTQLFTPSHIHIGKQSYQEGSLTGLDQTIWPEYSSIPKTQWVRATLLIQFLGWHTLPPLKRASPLRARELAGSRLEINLISYWAEGLLWIMKANSGYYVRI